MNAIIYDIEILKAVPNRDGSKPVGGVDYCAGWHDHANMGVSVLGAYDMLDQRWRVFLADNREEWNALITNRRPLCVGFNSIPFDNAVLRATPGWMAPDEDQCYDILREVWVAQGLGPVFDSRTHYGVGLDAMAAANFGLKKTGNGALAPALWQQGKHGEVIDYCLQDVRLTALLFARINAGLDLRDPRAGRAPLQLRRPA